MLNSIKAISIGVISILILGLINQLVLIMAAVGYNSLMKWSEAFIPWSQLFTYSLAGLGFFIVMTLGGLFTAIASENKTFSSHVYKNNAYRNAIIASIIGSSISLYLSLQQEIFTVLALLFLILGVCCSIFGCWLWVKRQKL